MFTFFDEKNLNELNESLDMAAIYARQAIMTFKCDGLYKVYSPDDFCAELELTGIDTDEACAYHKAALDMDINVIHCFLEQCPHIYNCREQAVLASIVLLDDMNIHSITDVDRKTKIEKLYSHLRQDFITYLHANQKNKEALNAAEGVKHD